jgi:hypothetical protein
VQPLTRWIEKVALCDRQEGFKLKGGKSQLKDIIIDKQHSMFPYTKCGHANVTMTKSVS